jgi:DUF1680 family protein
MMRGGLLAVLDGDASYDDYWERNLYNGILAQQNSIPAWWPTLTNALWFNEEVGTPTDDFWCCHGRSSRRIRFTRTTSL